MSTKKEDLHCGVPIPARDAPQLAWIEFNDQFERNMAWANTLLERPAAILRQWLDFDFDCPEEDYDEDTDTFEGEGNAEIRLRESTLAFLEERALQKDQGDAHAEAIRLGMRVEDVEREQRGLLARLRAGEEVDLKVIPPQHPMPANRHRCVLKVLSEPCDNPEPPHTCPYAEDVNDDHETLCTCCEACQRECCDDI